MHMQVNSENVSHVDTRQLIYGWIILFVFLTLTLYPSSMYQMFVEPKFYGKLV